MARSLAVVTTALALLGIAATLEHLLQSDHHNPGFHDYVWTTRSHVVLGAVYLGLALLQFASPIRRRWPALHRASGRVAVACGIASGVTALVIAALFPFSGPVAMIVVGPFALLFLVSLGRGIWLARARRFEAHREWMIRALAIGTSISTMRLIFVPLLIAMGESEELARWLSLLCFGIAFVLHSAVAELWIRATREAEAEVPFYVAPRRRPVSTS